MRDVDEQSRMLRWSYAIRPRRNVRPVLDLAVLPHQRSPLEATPPPTADSWGPRAP